MQKNCRRRHLGKVQGFGFRVWGLGIGCRIADVVTLERSEVAQNLWRGIGGLNFEAGRVFSVSMIAGAAALESY